MLQDTDGLFHLFYGARSCVAHIHCLTNRHSLPSQLGGTLFHLAKSLVQSPNGLFVLHPLWIGLIADDTVLLFEESNGLLDTLDGELATLGLCLLSVVDDLGLGIYRLVFLFDRLFLLIETGDICLTLTL